MNFPIQIEEVSVADFIDKIATKKEERMFMNKVMLGGRNTKIRKYKSVHFECDHDTKEMDTGITVSNYHPLSKRQIYILLSQSKQTGNNRLRNSIQIRLIQGICPHSIEENFIKRSSEVTELFLENMHLGPTKKIVNRLHALMNN